MMAVSLPSLLPAPTLVFPGPLGHWPLGSRLPHSSLTLPSNWMFVSFEDYIIKVTLLTLFKLLVLFGGVIGHECPMAGWWVNLPELTSQVKPAQVKPAPEQHVMPPGYWYPDLEEMAS